ncbi:MAG TPA: topoisomerase DNA-binding C4 zinc finger domain-containing protein [Woeseiaceae bacterium]|nr:topoisomerase DNA-binding C4 zinc finger domain-containing protein [Woeseiaceae bacterium]
MARRRSNILRDLYEIGGMLPWWMTAPLALGTYALLHQYAVSDPVVAADPGDALGTLLPNVLREVAVYAQYIVPWLMVVGMLSAVLRRATRAQLLASPPEERQPEERQPGDSSGPACPRCKGRMLRRTAKRGENAGNDFWGCSRFPACHGTREIETEESYALSA